jgi:hypothetical protein
MQTQNKGGDVLASGGVKCQFPPAGNGISQKKWDEIWKDYVPEKSFIKPKRKRNKGASLIEICVVLGITLTIITMGVPIIWHAFQDVQYWLDLIRKLQ